MNKYLYLSLFLIFFVVSCEKQNDLDSSKENSFETQITEYIKDFPYQDTFNYAMRYTKGDLSNFNIWVLGQEPVLVKAGQDKVVRMNNDTFYKMAFVVLNEGPVQLSSNAPSNERFNSFQLMDDRNANYRNVIHPSGKYTLYHGEKPDGIEGEAIEVPSELSVVIVRVEVKDKNNPDDINKAEKVFRGITIKGPQIKNVKKVDLLSKYDEQVSKEANKRLDENFAKVPFRKTVVGPGQKLGEDVSLINFAAGTKGGWGGPDTSHSSYETIFFDRDGKEMTGKNGNYSVTTKEPPVDAFWSLTVYDTDRGGFLHPNKYDRYHINNTSAVKNEDDSVTFNFKQNCEESDLNCLEVPEGRFDIAARYYLPHKEITSGEWALPKIELQK